MQVSWRVEFLLPLKYNDKRDVEPDKIMQVKDEILAKFGGISIHPNSIEGAWIDKDVTYCDYCKRFEVSVEKTPENLKWWEEYKEKLKKLFNQHEIYVHMTEIQRI